MEHFNTLRTHIISFKKEREREREKKKKKKKKKKRKERLNLSTPYRNEC